MFQLSTNVDFNFNTFLYLSFILAVRSRQLDGVGKRTNDVNHCHYFHKLRSIFVREMKARNNYQFRS